MKSRILTCITAIALFAVMRTLVSATQEQGDVSAIAGTEVPVPLISQPLLPDAIRPGAAGFTLTVNGTGFVSGSVVKWNGSNRATTFASSSRLKASILATDIAKAGTAWVKVVNPSPGGTSNLAFFEITRPTSSVALSTSSVHAGSNPKSVAVGDFNGDGKLDLAVANLSSGNVSIRLGNGDGTFRALVNYATGNSPNSIAVGDFNRDGKLDLAVANIGAGNGVSSVSVLLGRGDGTFRPAINYSAGSFPQSVAVGDFNGDGKLDLAVASFGSGVSILLGNGDGTFKSPANYGESGPTSVAVGDFNGDGKLDLAVANLVTNSGLSNVRVLLGNGNGTFQPAVNYGLGSNPSSVAVGDFNGDGKLDLAVANLGGYGNGASLSVLLGNGTGTFQPAVEYIGAGSNPSSLAVGDFNGDGRLDMAVADPNSSTVAVLLQPRLVSGLNAILEPPGVTFATTQLVGTTSPVQPVLLSNYGTLTLSIASISASGDFKNQNQTCGSSLAPGASCRISVAFRPTQGGTRTGTLSVTDNAPGSPQRVSLSGTGTVVKLSPTSLGFVCGPFGPFRSCVCTPSQTTTLTNVGSTALDITGITITGPFSQANTCDANVGAGKSCAITVTWSRSTGGGAVSVSDNGGGSPQKVSLSGNKLCSP